MSGDLTNNHSESDRQIPPVVPGVEGTIGSGPDAERLNSQMEIRNRFLVPLEIGIDENVPQYLYSAIREAVNDVLTCAGRNRKYRLLGSKSEPHEHNWASQAVKETMQLLRSENMLREVPGFGPQLLREILMLHVLDSSLNEKSAIPLLITGFDLRSCQTNFLLCSAYSEHKVGMVSVARFIHADFDEDLIRLGVMRSVKFTLGHMFGLPGRDSTDSTSQSSLGTFRDCANICSIRNAWSAETWVSYAKQERADSICFCEDCSKVLNESAVALQELPE
jgi:hypothetical protein